MSQEKVDRYKQEKDESEEEHEKAAHYEHCQKVCTVTGCIGIGGMARIFRICVS